MGSTAPPDASHAQSDPSSALGHSGHRCDRFASYSPAACFGKLDSVDGATLDLVSPEASSCCITADALCSIGADDALCGIGADDALCGIGADDALRARAGERVKRVKPAVQACRLHVPCHQLVRELMPGTTRDSPS